LKASASCLGRRESRHSAMHTLRDIDLGKKEPEEEGGGRKEGWSSSSPGASAPDDCGSRRNSNTRPREFHHTQTHAHYLPPRPTCPSAAAVPSELRSLERASQHTHIAFLQANIFMLLLSTYCPWSVIASRDVNSGGGGGANAKTLKN